MYTITSVYMRINPYKQNLNNDAYVVKNELKSKASGTPVYSSSH